MPDSHVECRLEKRDQIIAGELCPHRKIVTADDGDLLAALHGCRGGCGIEPVRQDQSDHANQDCDGRAPRGEDMYPR